MSVLIFLSTVAINIMPILKAALLIAKISISLMELVAIIKKAA